MEERTYKYFGQLKSSINFSEIKHKKYHRGKKIRSQVLMIANRWSGLIIVTLCLRAKCIWWIMLMKYLSINVIYR